MDLDNIQQNMNTRVVFREPRGMIRWIQLFFAILAFSTVVDFHTKVGVNIQCSTPPVTPSPSPSPSTKAPTSAAPVVAPANQSASTTASSVSTTTTTTTTTPSPAPTAAPSVAQAQNYTVELNIIYPFDLGQQTLMNPCPGQNGTYVHIANLTASPQFFVMAGVLSLMYASASLTFYLFFSSSYDSIPIIPVVDLIITAVLCLFWFIGATSFSSGVSMLKTTVVYESIIQPLCHSSICTPGAVASWKSLNIGLISGYTSFFVWGSGMWFVFKETHFHTPRDQFR